MGQKAYLKRKIFKLRVERKVSSPWLSCLIILSSLISYIGGHAASMSHLFSNRFDVFSQLSGKTIKL